MRTLRWVLLALGASTLPGCFPDYQTSDSSGPGPYMVRLKTGGQTFGLKFYDLGVGADVSHKVSFSRDFDIDEFEVTVKRFHDWWDDPNRPMPCAGCALDDGPYASSMKWHTEWNATVNDGAFRHADGCQAPAPFDGGPTTWDVGEDNLPMTCVNWMQAAAFCAWDGKRLPTVAEWMWARTEGGEAKHAFPWGDTPPTCADAWVNADGKGCGFPKTVGTAGKDGTADSVQDLVGSVFEWVWDAHWPDSPPLDPTDYAGPNTDAGLNTQHLRAGGAFISDPVSDQRLTTGVEPFTSTERYADAGFRCAKSAP